MKTVEEWSNSFDVLLADYIRINQSGFTSPLSFDEYEKSLFLTKSLELIVQELYSSNTAYFEQNEAVRRYLEPLVKQANCSVSNSTSILSDKYNHKVFSLPDDCWYIVYELAQFDSEDTCIKSVISDVNPITHDEYQRVIRNPFRGPNKRKVLRLDNNKQEVELVSSIPVNTYVIRYLCNPTPIVLLDIEDDKLTIEGISKATTCLLPESIHQQILDRAIRLALSSRITNNNNAS